MFAIKTELLNIDARSWTFAKQKTVYGGKSITQGDIIFIFAGGTDAGSGLVAQGTVTEVEAIPKLADIARQTPRVSISIECTSLPRRRLGRIDLKPCKTWGDGLPETELNFKLYRQATNKIIGISPAAAAYLRRFF